MKANRGFTLIEVLAVAFVVTLVAGLLLPPALSSFLIGQRIRREDAILAQLQADIERSFEARDLDTFNVSALPGEIDAATSPTEFSASVAPAYPAITGREWFAKVARARGFSVAAGQPVNRSSQPALYDLACNDADRPRL
jgi:prepilin-type N-terminal cleavage/methylation domain-containing protein